MSGGPGACLGCGAPLLAGGRTCPACKRALSPSELARTGAPPEPTGAPPPPRPTADLTPPPTIPIRPVMSSVPRPPDRRQPGSSGPLGRVRHGLKSLGQGAVGCLSVLFFLGLVGGFLQAVFDSGATSGPSEAAAAPTPTPGSVTPEPWSTPEPASTPEDASTPAPTPRVVALAQAMDEGLVELTAEGRNLQTLDITLRSLTDETLVVEIPAGLLFGSNASDTQSMVSITPTSIELEPGDSQGWGLDVACAQMHLDEPESGDTFRLSTAPEALQRLVSSEAFAAADFRVQQFAVWTLTDDPTRDGYVQIGSAGTWSGPTSDELDAIRDILVGIGLDPSKYRALR